MFLFVLLHQVEILIKAEQLRALSEERLQEANLLYQNSLLQGAFYIAGYAIEFSLKALICKRLGIEPFDQPQKGVRPEFSSDVKETLQTHDLSFLVVFAGLYPDLKHRKTQDPVFFAAWSSVSEWSEQRRYEPLVCSKQTVKEFINKVTIIKQWVDSHY